MIPILILILLGSCQSKFQTQMNPGMAIRLEQKTIEAWKTSMKDFLP